MVDKENNLEEVLNLKDRDLIFARYDENDDELREKIKEATTSKEG